MSDVNPPIEEQVTPHHSGVRPLGARIAVQLVSVGETVRDSGVILPQTDNTDTYKADVVVIGDAVRFVKEGDMVLLTVGAIQGAVFAHNQEHYAMIYEADVLAVLDRS